VTLWLWSSAGETSGSAVAVSVWGLLMGDKRLAPGVGVLVWVCSFVLQGLDELVETCSDDSAEHRA
jgi:hypothetical protein